MATPTLNITGNIGQWGYSKTVVQNFLAENKDKEVTICVSSLGGDFDHALSIHNQIAKHGKVTIDFEGFNASSATIMSLGAKKITASKNSFYFIHKVSSWVDLWGSMNEDELQSTIDKLTKEKKENEKMTLVLAQMYIHKTSCSLQDTFKLMKEEAWMTADEACKLVSDVKNKKKIRYIKFKKIL
jgi:ATP-dependent protease ClpP protease subunit